MGMPKENEKYSRRKQCSPPHFLMCPPIGRVADLVPPRPMVSSRRKTRANANFSRTRQYPAASRGHHVGHQGHRLPCPPEGLTSVAGAALLPWPPSTQVPRNLAAIHSHSPVFSLPPDTESSTSYITSPHLHPQSYHSLDLITLLPGSLHPSAHWLPNSSLPPSRLQPE